LEQGEVRVSRLRLAGREDFGHIYILTFVHLKNAGRRQSKREPNECAQAADERQNQDAVHHRLSAQVRIQSEIALEDSGI
jgi:hypothetical protein